MESLDKPPKMGLIQHMVSWVRVEIGKRFLLRHGKIFGMIGCLTVAILLTCLQKRGTVYMKEEGMFLTMPIFIRTKVLLLETNNVLF